MLLLLGCGASPKPNAPPSPASPAPSPREGDLPPTLESFEASLITLPEPNHFQVRLSWKGSSHPLALTRFREGITEHLASIEPSVTQFLDEKVKPTEKYDYLLASPDGISLKASMTIPEDLVIAGNTSFNTWKGHRLFFKKEAKLFTHGKPTSLSANTIVSDGGKILVFEEGKSAPPGCDGESPSKIEIRSENAAGILTIILDGERGGSGLSGSPGAPGRTGQAGFNALCRIQENERGSSRYCKSEATDGLAGSKGGDGSPGSIGGRGGATSPLIVDIKDSHALDLRVLATGGSGGPGGVGGSGGRGGLGGPPGSNLPSCGCHRKANWGLVGPVGPNGLLGTQGQPGIKSPLCLKLGTGIFGDCAAFEKEY